MSNQIVNNQELSSAPSLAANANQSSGSAAFEPGMVGLTSAALLEVEKLLSEVANLQGEQFVKQVESAKTTAKFLGDSQRQMGVDEFNQYLVQGITQAVGGFLSLGTVALSEGITRFGDTFGVKETQQELNGVENYRNAVKNRETIANLSENNVTSEEDGIELETIRSNADDITEQVQKRVEELKNKDSFTDENKKALKVAEQSSKTEGIEIDDLTTIKNIKDDTEAKELLDSFDVKTKSLKETQSQQIGAQSSFRQTISTVGQGLNGMTSGIGTASSSKYSKDKADDQASATEAQAALQGLQQVDQLTQSEFTKLKESATAVNQNISSIASSNALIN